ncbi:hypothetical protein GCM10010960_20490 [Arenimonas maotaiensis]|uniref:Uncharacterized protein n=1 Tax=Arenimonas maotaiensis TaxID=1446479 RepID=A0A917CUN1_9GAMM|nr:hypothetical protein GCM10010960_20490 [Arenimonas maotaiensis]
MLQNMAASEPSGLPTRAAVMAPSMVADHQRAQPRTAKQEYAGTPITSAGINANAIAEKATSR